MRILIIEDELPTQRMLTDLITGLRPEWMVEAAVGSVADAIEWFGKNEQPDLIFSDIQLTDGTCFEIYEQISVSSFIIFTTAYDEYAVQAFKVNSVDYLLKPVSVEMLEKAIEKFESYQNTGEKSTPDMKELMESLLNGRINYRSRLMVSVADGFVKVDVKDVALFHSSNKVTSATTFNRKNYIVDLTLDKLEMQLNPELFFRANRQFVLNINSITKIENWFNGKLIVKTRPEAAEKIIVSRERARAFKEWIDR